MSKEYHLKHRPTSLAEVVGQPEAVKQLEGFLRKRNVPHALLFAGGSGCGKTTLARIIARELGCEQADFAEVNAADARGIDDVRAIRKRVSLAPLHGGCRVWLIDEAHKVTPDGQTALLKILEDTPPHAYFMLATTDSEKLLPTIRNRCTKIVLKPVPPSALKELVQEIADKEKLDISKAVVQRIVEVADGCAREAVKLLGSIANLKTDEDRLNAVQPESVRRAAHELFKAMLWEKPNLAGTMALIRDLQEDAETLRRIVLSVAANELMKGGRNSARAYDVILAFESNFYDSGKAGLARAVYEVLGK